MAFSLATTYFDAPEQSRREEMRLCLYANTSAAHKTLVVTDGDTFPTFNSAWAVQPTRPKFADLLDMFHSSDANSVNAITNGDILIPFEMLNKISLHLQPNQVYCLTRWEVSSSKGVHLWDVEYSQDAWVFRGPPKPNIGGDYWFGVPGCDNRFAAELDAAGYEVLNPSRDIRTYHIHASNQRTATNSEANRVPPPYLYVAPHHLGEQPNIRRAATWEQRKRVVAGRKAGMP